MELSFIRTWHALLAMQGCQLDDDCWEVSGVPLDEKCLVVFFSALPK